DLEQEEYLEALSRDRVLGYAVAVGVRDKPAKLVWRLPAKAGRCAEELVRLDRLRLESDDSGLNEQLNLLFQSMRRTSWIVYIIKRSVGELTDLLRLPPMFRLRSEEHTSELQSREKLVCRLLLEKKKKQLTTNHDAA